jgi:hypothetical protein
LLLVLALFSQSVLVCLDAVQLNVLQGVLKLKPEQGKQLFKAMAVMR